MIRACAHSPFDPTTLPTTKHSPRRAPMTTQTPSPATTITATQATASPPLDALKQRLRRVGLYGLLTHAEALATEPWLLRVLETEESERLQRSFKRRLTNARLGTFKP